MHGALKAARLTRMLYRENDVCFFEGVATVRLRLVTRMELHFAIREDRDMNSVRHAHPVWPLDRHDLNELHDVPEL